MKYIWLLLTLLSTNIFAADAIVIVLQAPLLREAKYESTILQFVRKGERVYVPNQIAALSKWPEFIETYDRAGNIAYVPSKYLKVVSNDESEYQQTINYGKHDPTDYRLEEPIPKSYPFNNYSFLKLSVAWTLGNNVKAPYEYINTFSRQEYSTEKGGRISIMRRVEFDNYDRFYFGLYMAASSVRNYFEFTAGEITTEKRSILRIGPMLTFDTFKSNDLRVTLGTGFTYNYHRAYIQFSDSAGNGDERLFSGFSLSPFLTAYAQFENIVPYTDFIIGADFNFYSGRNLTAESGETLYEWPSDSIKEQAGPQGTIYLGAQFKY